MIGSIPDETSVQSKFNPNGSLSTQSEDDVESSFKCCYCSQTFDTRNALFRHLRNDPVCSLKYHDAGKNGTFKKTKNGNGRILTMVKESIALQFGYMDNIVAYVDKQQVISKNENAVTTMAEDVGRQDTLFDSIKNIVRTWYELGDNDFETLGKMEILGSIQASLAKLRRAWH